MAQKEATGKIVVRQEPGELLVIPQKGSRKSTWKDAVLQAQQKAGENLLRFAQEHGHAAIMG